MIQAVFPWRASFGASLWMERGVRRPNKKIIGSGQRNLPQDSPKKRAREVTVSSCPRSVQKPVDRFEDDLGLFHGALVVVQEPGEAAADQVESGGFRRGKKVVQGIG